MFDENGQIRIIEGFFSIAVIFLVLLISVTVPSTLCIDKQRSLTNS